ncbi:sigma-70 family RNA polymerase sigma factor [Streptomyces sp. NPDC017941]|uniref:sigma-70 family RNA polymerase sigma factor n=1 Tax=Streptomyces sp. NPDC017941 TaxID=3365018 RepID=UPI003789247D
MSTDTLADFRQEHGDPVTWSPGDFDAWLALCDQVRDQAQSGTEVRPAGPEQLSAEGAARLDRLFRLYSRRVLAYAATCVRRPEDAQDVAGETWVQASGWITSLRSDDERAVRWLFAITRHAAVALYRPKRAGEQPRDWADEVESRPLPSSRSADEDVVVLFSLPVQERRVIELAARGLAQMEIADRLGCDGAQVFRWLDSGARRLRASVALAG